MAMPEYGRSIHEMVNYAKTIENKEERQLCAETIVRIMATKETDADVSSQPDFENRLWDHLFYIANYELDVDCPYEITRLDTESVRPRMLKLPKKDIRHLQYGYMIEETLRRAAEMPEGEERQALLRVVANQMKQNLFTWNRDAMDEQKVLLDIKRYTGGKVELDADFVFDAVHCIPKQGDPMAFFAGKSKKKR